MAWSSLSSYDSNYDEGAMEIIPSELMNIIKGNLLVSGASKVMENGDILYADAANSLQILSPSDGAESSAVEASSGTGIRWSNVFGVSLAKFIADATSIDSRTFNGLNVPRLLGFKYLNAYEFSSLNWLTGYIDRYKSETVGFSLGTSFDDVPSILFKYYKPGSAQFRLLRSSAMDVFSINSNNTWSIPSNRRYRIGILRTGRSGTSYVETYAVNGDALLEMEPLPMYGETVISLDSENAINGSALQRGGSEFAVLTDKFDINFSSNPTPGAFVAFVIEDVASNASIIDDTIPIPHAFDITSTVNNRLDVTWSLPPGTRGTVEIQYRLPFVVEGHTEFDSDSTSSVTLPSSSKSISIPSRYIGVNSGLIRGCNIPYLVEVRMRYVSGNTRMWTVSRYVELHH